MTDRGESDSTSQIAVRKINLSIEAVNAEISARRNSVNDVAHRKRNRQFLAAKSASLSDAADIARAAARQLTVANARVRDAVASAEAADFIVQEDFSVVDYISRSTRSRRARVHAVAIQAAVADLVALDEHVASRLRAAAGPLNDMRDD
jgi:hypothetical protein